MGERTAEVGSIDVVAFLLGDVDLLTARAVYFHPRGAYLFAHANGKSRLSVAKHSRTDSKSPLAIFFPHDG